MTGIPPVEPPERSDEGRGFSGRVAVLFATQVGTAAIGTLIGFFVAGVLGPTRKGELYVLTLLPTTFMVLLQFGLNQAFGFYAGRGQTRGLPRKTLVLASVLGGIPAVVLAGLLLQLGGAQFREVDPLGLLLALAALPLLLNATFTSAIVLGRQAVGTQAIVNVATTSIYVALLIVLVGGLDFGVLGGVVAFFAAQTVQTVGFAIAARRVANPNSEAVGYRALFRYGLPYFPGSLTQFFSARADVFLITALVANPAAPLGWYSMAVSIAELVFFLPNAVGTLFFPHVAGAHRDDSSRQVTIVARSTLLVTALVALLLVPVSAWLIPALLPAFTPALVPLWILLPGVLALSTTKVLTGFVAGLGMSGTVSAVGVASFALNVVLNVVFIPAFGIAGAAAASLVSYSASSIALSIVAGRLAGVAPLAFWSPRRSDLQFLVSTGLAFGLQAQDRLRWPGRRRAIGLSAGSRRSTAVTIPDMNAPRSAPTVRQPAAALEGPASGTRMRERWERTVAILQAPRVKVRMFGSDEIRAIHAGFTGPHPRLRVLPAKRYGVALLEVPESLEAYLERRGSLRKRRARALRLGYLPGTVDPSLHVDEILEVNRSLPDRQGQPMAAHYLDRDRIAAGFATPSAMHVVRDGAGRIRAYAVVRPMGEAALIAQILGHGEHLDQGIMFVLMARIVEAAAEERTATGVPHWLMYDTFWGASRGLAFFKERAGFTPYTVDWRWAGPDDAGGATGGAGSPLAGRER